MSDPRLIVPADVEDLVIDVVRARHTEHLAALERSRGLAPETLERLRTVGHLSAAGARNVGDQEPSVLVGSIGLDGEPRRNADDGLDVTLSVAAEIAVIGTSRRDVIRRRDLTTWSVVECILQRLPRTGTPVTAVRLRDVETLEETDGNRIRGSARILLAVDVEDAVSLRGLPAHGDPNWPPGTPGGPPPDGEPYADPLDPPVATDVTFTIDREEP